MSSTKGDAPLHDAGRLERGDDTTNSSQKSEANAANSHQAAPPITKSAVIRALQPAERSSAVDMQPEDVGGFSY